VLDAGEAVSEVVAMKKAAFMGDRSNAGIGEA
jgi:hypothetical protein